MCGLAAVAGAVGVASGTGVFIIPAGPRRELAQWAIIGGWRSQPRISRRGFPVQVAGGQARLAQLHHRSVHVSKELTLAKDDPKTSIDAGGLRYRSKVAGSPFSATGAFGAATMSCFLCGKHRPRAQLKSRKLLGKAQAVCSPSCRELDAAQP